MQFWWRTDYGTRWTISIGAEVLQSLLEVALAKTVANVSSVALRCCVCPDTKTSIRSDDS